jgi:hypothetical protein
VKGPATQKGLLRVESTSSLCARPRSIINLKNTPGRRSRKRSKIAKLIGL